MSRLLLSACAAALTLAAAPALSQTFPTTGTPIIADASQAPLALPRAQPAIPAPVDTPYPGVIRYKADVTDLERKIVNVTETIPVAAGPLTLLYPEYLPGNHAATGPIQLISGVTVTGGGKRIEWLRDTIQPYAFHLDIPEGVTEIEVSFQWLTQPDNANWRVTMTPSIVNMQWEKALLYPAGHYSRRITFAPSIQLPAGWGYGTALETESFENGLATFKPTDLYTLVDSPMYAGANHRRVDIDPTGDAVHMEIVADKAANLAITDEQIGLYQNMVTQADRLFGARHFDHYDVLMALSDQLGGIGLEHHRSSENTGGPGFFTEWDKNAGGRATIPHEFTHSWNGKFMRPADELTANYNVPTQNTLLWVYEGQTEYWGHVLAARSGIHTVEEEKILLAGVAAFYENQPGREWRALQDTDNHNLLGYRVPGQWTSWMRGTGDYYRESQLMWLDADTLIREGTDNRKSLDDFARAFFGVEDGRYTPRGYTFEEVVAALNGVYAHDWATFLRGRLDAVGPDARAPTDGITRAGYFLTYTDTLTALEKKVMSGWATDFQYSLGFTLSGPTNRLSNIRWGSPAFNAPLGAGWDLIAVNEVAATPEVLRDAVTAAKTSTDPIVLLLKNGSRYRTVSFDYHEGLRYPRLARTEGAPDRLADIWAPRRR
ncbi:M61 family metallopeptidase [Brevundimonas goettingensis]|uniref:M61 family metallopeptidase n=1 Tax=Brevundimonas goettingensis TaxID=2774190 RepID=A0A975C4Q4_9CAUL|nr:M61 family metallopeptidase [Brevundimonas goettingensis]QTC92434.1 M61 family metallopeptidase [Brevundimonas goettingensis]